MSPRWTQAGYLPRRSPFASNVGSREPLRWPAPPTTAVPTAPFHTQASAPSEANCALWPALGRSGGHSVAWPPQSWGPWGNLGVAGRGPGVRGAAARSDKHWPPPPAALGQGSVARMACGARGLPPGPAPRRPSGSPGRPACPSPSTPGPRWWRKAVRHRLSHPQPMTAFTPDGPPPSPAEVDGPMSAVGPLAPLSCF